LHEEPKYDKFINLVGSIERRLLPQHFDPDFYLPDEQRRRIMNRNYIEALHEWADVPFGKNWQKFTPTSEEIAWAVEERSKIDGHLVFINAAGSSVPKWWPYAQELADMLSAEGINVRIVGDVRFTKFRESRFTKVIGTTMSIRKVFTLARYADVVVGTESAIVNAVAYEPPLKIVTLSHSTHENLTRDWLNTMAIEPDQGVKCYPCHRIHTDMTHCSYVKQVNSAACQAAANPELVFQHIMAYLNPAEEKAA
jgi:ADP-heptose:LPS heptosyltransferase